MWSAYHPASGVKPVWPGGPLITHSRHEGAIGFATFGGTAISVCLPNSAIQRRTNLLRQLTPLKRLFQKIGVLEERARMTDQSLRIA